MSVIKFSNLIILFTNLLGFGLGSCWLTSALLKCISGLSIPIIGVIVISTSSIMVRSCDDNSGCSLTVWLARQFEPFDLKSGRTTR